MNKLYRREAERLSHFLKLELGFKNKEDNQNRILERQKRYSDLLLLKIFNLEHKPLIDEVLLSEDGITVQNIEMVMDHTACSRNQAIRSLRESKDDFVSAVLKLVM